MINQDYSPPLDLIWNVGLWICFQFSCPCMRPHPYLGKLWINFIHTWQKDNKRCYTWAHNFVSWCDQRWPTGSHFRCKKKHPGVQHVLKHFLDMHLPILFKLGTQIMNDGLFMHVIIFWDNIQDGRLVAILLLNSVPSHFLDMQGPILFKRDKCHKCSCMSHDHSSQLCIHIHLVNMG